jgi:hypothetical protein
LTASVARTTYGAGPSTYKVNEYKVKGARVRKYLRTRAKPLLSIVLLRALGMRTLLAATL